ncbi:MAG: hypothetical protein J0M37_01185 [Ignavibacteria bacterium]|nr:hypothetical protein [Ignavibacteria bacterium]
MVNKTLQKNLEILKFKESNNYGSMVGYIDDIRFTAIEHPFGKVFLLTADCSITRTVSQIEENVTVEADLKEIAEVMVKMYEKVKS